jgi:hypothetical protein
VLRRLLLLLVCVAALVPGAALPAYAATDPVGELAARYAPVVVVREQTDACGVGEPYLPTPVTTVLGKSDVVLRGPQGQAISAPTAADLAGKGEGWYLDLPGNPLDPGCDYERWFDQASAGSAPTLYARTATDPDHPGVLVLQYWFFWTYNDWNDKHEGDWEMVQLSFDADSVEEALAVAPTSVAFAQHEGSETAAWTDTKLHKDGDHIAVYPGQGSHAAYYTQAQWFGKSAAAGFGCDNTLAQGVVVRPEIVVLPETGTTGAEWLDFTGRWGQKAPSFNNGPTGPTTKTQWDHPVSWQLEEGRPDAVALPTVGGPAVTGFCELTEAGSLLFIQVLDRPAVVLGVLAVLLVLLIVGIARTDWFNDDDPELDRERKAGQMAVAAVDLMRKEPTALWLPAVLVAGASALNLGVAQFLLRARPGEDLADVNGFASNLFGIGLALAVSFLMLPVVAFGMAVAVEIVDSLAHHERITSGTAFRRVLVHPGGWVVAISVYIVVTLLAATWWLLPVALYLMARWAVGLPATELEDRGVRAGLKRSSELTRGHRLRSALIGGFLVWMAFSLPSGIGAVVLLATGWPFWVTNLLSILAAAVLVPAASIGLTLLYYDLRRRAAARDAVGAGV